MAKKSDITTKGLERATHRALYYSMGLLDEDLDKPIIGIVNSQNEAMPGHRHLDTIARAVKEGVIAAGGTPIEFPTIGICDGIAQGNYGMHYPLASRELIADSVECMMNGHSFDAMVMIPDCDKITPGMIIAAARLDVPTIIVSGGVMMTGCMDGEKVGYTDLMEASGLVQRGIKSHEWLNKLEHCALPGCGACNLLGTANSMNFLTEALGLCLPGATALAMSGRKLAIAKRTGMQIMELYKKTYQENAHRFSFSLHSYYRMEHCRTCYWHTFMPDNCYEPSGSTHCTFMHHRICRTDSRILYRNLLSLQIESETSCRINVSF